MRKHLALLFTPKTWSALSVATALELLLLRWPFSPGVSLALDAVQVLALAAGWFVVCREL